MPPSGEAPFSPADERNTSPLDERGFSSLGERGISPDSECSLSKNSITILSISYMRRNLSTLFLGAALLFAATSSCTNELPDGTACGDAAISFRTPAVTRAAVEGDFPEGSKFSVWGWYTGENGSSNQPFDKVPVTNSNGTWSYTGGDRYWVLGAEYDFYAVYPAGLQNVDCTDQGVVTVTGFDASKTGNEAVDLMTARKTGVQADESTVASAVALEFGHELAKVSVVLRTDPGVTATLNSASLYGMALEGSFSRDLKNGGNAAWDLNNAVTSDDTPFKVSNISFTGNESKDIIGPLLLIPQPVSGLKLFINLTRNGNEEVTETIDLGTSITRWAAGQTYRYVLTVKVDAITFSDFTVPEWEESGTGGNVNIGSDSNN